MIWTFIFQIKTPIVTKRFQFCTLAKFHNQRSNTFMRTTWHLFFTKKHPIKWHLDWEYERGEKYVIQHTSGLTTAMTPSDIWQQRCCNLLHALTEWTAYQCFPKGHNLMPTTTLIRRTSGVGLYHKNIKGIKPCDLNPEISRGFLSIIWNYERIITINEQNKQ